MSRTRKDRVRKENGYIVHEVYAPGWGRPGVGKWWKRQYWKAMRSWQKETGGRERSALRYGRECEWKRT